MAITTNNSISVKPLRKRNVLTVLLPLRLLNELRRRQKGVSRSRESILDAEYLEDIKF
jgi:hypothetical protein